MLSIVSDYPVPLVTYCVLQMCHPVNNFLPFGFQNEVNPGRKWYDVGMGQVDRTSSPSPKILELWGIQ